MWPTWLRRRRKRAQAAISGWSDVVLAGVSGLDAGNTLAADTPTSGLPTVTALAAVGCEWLVQEQALPLFFNRHLTGSRAL